MNEDFDIMLGVSKKYLFYRQQVLNYTNEEMNLSLENEEQVYIAVFDIPLKSSISGFQTQSLALVFGLNTHIYHGSGGTTVGLEEYPQVKKAMQSLLISSHQALSKMDIIEDTGYYDSDYIRVYLKTEKAIYFKELKEDNDVNEF